MKRTKTQKGITLIALIITIVVLLILAVVAIRAVQNTGIITHAKNATTEYHSKQDEEEIKLALEEWKIVKYTQADTTFESFLKSKFGESNVSEQNDDDSYTVTIAECGDRYKVYEDGTITPTKGISITATDFPLKIKNGATEMPTGTLKAVLIDIEGTVTWSIGDTAVATISATEGEEITVTAVAKGETKITATCGEYKAEYTIKVTQPVNIAKGAFVKYDVAYTDAYYSDYQYTTTNGWRLLDYTENADGKTYSNVKLISTGIPARLYYSYASNNSFSSNGWWVDDAESFKDTLRDTAAGESYNFYTGTDIYYALQASAGLYHNFGSIKFKYGTTNDANKGYFTSITSNGTTYDSSNADEKTGNDLFKVEGIDATVRLLTLPELNKALGRTDIDSTSDISDSTGLYELESISTAGIGLASNTYTTGYYWLASPFTNVSPRSYVSNVSYDGRVNNNTGLYLGVRPAVCLTSNVQIEDTDGDGVLDIK